MKALTIKKIIISTVMVLTSSFAFADSKKTLCNFPYDLAEEGGVKFVRTIAITAETKLTPLQEAQVLKTARVWGEEMDYDGYQDIQQAIQVLRSDSEAGDLNLSIFRFEGEVYTEVVIYPGGNAFGLIFDGKKVVAELHDGDVVCK